jgi:IS1 family transposase/transposase-like protein
MDWETLYCPNRSCRFYGLPWRQSALVKNGASYGQKQALCRACGRSVYLRHATAYFELDTDPAIFETAIRALAEGNGVRGTARIVQIDKDTASAWLDRAAQHCRHVLLYLWHDLHLTECQLDELWSFVHTKEEHLPAAKLWCATDGDAWVSLAFAPVWRLVVAFVVGKRTQACANLLLERVKHVTSADIPFLESDQLAEYRTALLQVYGQWYQPARNGDRGRFPHRRRIAPPELLYAQVVKHRERGQVIAVTNKVVFGDPALIAERLAASEASVVINTSFVERENLTLRHHNRRLTRKTIAFSKEVDWLERQLWVALAYYHLVLPHASLRRRLDELEPTRGSGSERRWCAITPAMAAGLTDHIWSTTELLSYRVPAAFLDRLSDLERLFPSFNPIHQGN